MRRWPQDLLLRLVEWAFRTRTVHDARRILKGAWLVLTFGVLIVAPVTLLAWFALTSLQEGSESVEADLAPRAYAISRQVRADEAETFDRFEAQVTRRLLRNQSPVNALDELSSELLAAYALREATIVEPFDLPADLEVPEPSPAYERAVRTGLLAELDGRWSDGVASHGQAQRFTNHPRLAAQAALDRARASARGSGPDQYADVLGEYGNIRVPRGFRTGDLARLLQAEAAAARDPDGALALRELVDMLLASRWTLFEAGEPTVARRALRRLESMRADGVAVDAEWLARATRRLEQRDAELFWSGRLYDEMRDVTASPPPPGDGFVYRPSSTSPALWALRNTGDGLVVYAFDRAAIVDRLASTARRLADLDPELRATVTASDLEVAETGVFRQALDHLPLHEVRVAARDPAGLAAARRNRMFVRFAIIVLALATSVIGVVVTVRNVSRELAAARTKTDFAANVSHELRSPLTQIRLKAEALQLDLVFDDADRQAHYDAIVRESERLSRLVDNVLDFAAIEAGAKKYTLRPEDISSIVEYSVDAHATQISQAGMTIEVEVDEDLPALWLDREAISQVLTNLISNAIKYGADGKWLGVSARRDGERVELRVSDRGMGISREDQVRIFEDFFRSSHPAVRRKKGTGIGLTIVKYIVETHGGEIKVESAPGKGATFLIRLPLQPPSGAGA